MNKITTDNLENVSNNERTEMFAKILSIVSKLRLEKCDDDSYDHIGISYELEQLFMSENKNQL